MAVDDPVNFLLNSSKDVLYPAVWYTLNGASIQGKEKVYNFVITVADILHQEDETEIEVQSDCELIADDLLAYLDWNGQSWTLVRSTQYAYFREDKEDILAGVTFSVDLKVPHLYDSCAVPSGYAKPGVDYLATEDGLYILTEAGDLIPVES